MTEAHDAFKEAWGYVQEKGFRSGLIKKVKEEERKYWQMDGVMDEVVDELCIQLGKRDTDDGSMDEEDEGIEPITEERILCP